MKIVIASNGKKILKISKNEWDHIGKEAGWLDTVKDKFNSARETLDYMKSSPVENGRKPIKKDDTYNNFLINYESVKQIIAGIQQEVDNGKITNYDQMIKALSAIKNSGAIQEISQAVKPMLSTYPKNSKTREDIIVKVQEIKDLINALKSKYGVAS